MSMSLKVSYLLGSLNRGGTETLLLDVFRNAKQQNLDAIGLYRKIGALETDFKETKIPFYYLPTGKNILSYLFKLRKYFKQNNITVAHAQQPIDALYAYFACVFTKISVVLTFHGYDFTEDKTGFRILKFIIKRTTSNIYVSASQRDYYVEKYKLDLNKQFVIYNGISFDKLDAGISNKKYEKSESIQAEKVKSNQLKSELGLSENVILLGTVGNFNKVRDQITICRFLKLLKEQNVNFHFVFVGKKIENTPELYDACIQYCEENKLMDSVSFLGSRSDVPQILRDLDCFIYSTDHDTFGIAVVEAMACAIPVIVNDWKVMTEITGNGKYATLYKTKNEVDLLRVFMLFLLNIEAYQRNANEAANFVRNKFSIENHILNLKMYYNDLK